MQKMIEGGCLCGAVRVTVAGNTWLTMQCHCTDCRRAAGGGPAYIAMVAREDFTLAGALSRYTVTGASGGAVTRCFCPVCGTPTHSELEKYPDKLALKVGLFAADTAFTPSMAIWVASAPDWHPIPETIPRFELGPKPPSRQPAAPAAQGEGG